MVGGLLVLSGIALPLGLCILCPITANILIYHVVFHSVLTPRPGIIPGAVLALFELILIYAYRESFSGILSISEKPTV